MKKNDSLQVFRALCFLDVFFAHAGANEIFFKYLSLLFIPPMQGFFALSGFLYLLIYFEREEASDSGSGLWGRLCGDFRFALKKISKLYPLHILTTLYIALAIVLQALKNNELAARLPRLSVELLVNAALLQSWIPSFETSLNSVSWFFSCMAFLYFAFPLIKRFIKKVASVKKLLLVCAAVFLCQFLIARLADANCDLSFKLYLTYFLPLFRLGDFFCGCVLGYVWLRLKDKEFSAVWASVFQAATVLLSFFAFRFWMPKIPQDWSYASTVVLWTVFALAWICAFSFDKGVLCLLKRTPLKFIGDISAQAYLIHWCVLDFFDDLRGIKGIQADTDAKRYILALIELAVTIIACVLYIKIEGLVKERLAKKKAAQAASS